MGRNGRKAAVAATTFALCLGAAQAQIARVSYPSAETTEGMPAGAFDPQSQMHDDLLDGLDRLGANAKERNEINLDKNMMALAGSHKGGRYAELSQKMDLIVIRNYEFSAKGQYLKSDLDALRQKLEGAGWSHLVRNETSSEANDIVVKPAADGTISDMVILNAEQREVNIVHLRGHFRMEDVHSALGATVGLGVSSFGMAGAMGHVASHSAPPAPPASAAPPAPAPPPR